MIDPSAVGSEDAADDDGSAAGSRRLRGIIVPRRALWWTVPRRAIRGGGASTLGDGWSDDEATSERCGARSATPVAEEVDVLSATLEAMTECLARSGGLDETHRRE